MNNPDLKTTLGSESRSPELTLAAGQQPRSSGALASVRPQLLIVSQESALAKKAEAALLGGFSIMRAATGLQALHLARRTLPDFILVDEQLPDFEGASLCALLQRQPSTRDAQVVRLVPPANAPSDQGGELEPGQPLVLPKPLDLGRLAQRLFECLERRLEQRKESAELEFA